MKTRTAGFQSKGRKAQLFSADLLIATGIIAMAFGLFVNTYWQAQRNALGDIQNASSLPIAEGYYSQATSGAPLPGECTEANSIVTCDACPAPSDRGKFFEQRIYAQAGAVKTLRVGVCA
ncbi:TPA: hypothetical protein HA244_04845 [Candidatus Micrarchaeota archaeon]|nr:hypothetical protein [Candidatus Micrarchaeota archaeon]